MFTTTRAVVCLLALVSGAALADGVPIIVPAPALRAGDPALQLPVPAGFVKMHPVILAGGAFGANILLVTIDGKEYRFVGSVLPQAPRKANSTQPVSMSWAGKALGGGTLGITKFTGGDIHATITLPPSRLLVLSHPGASTVLVEIDRSAAYAPPLLVKDPVLAASGAKK